MTGMGDIATKHLLIFDLDGTLMESASGANFPRFIRDRKWKPARAQHVKSLRAAGFITALATNQGGAAFGIFRPDEMDAYLREVAAELNLSAWSVCYHHPNGRIPELTSDHPRRKPNPGMLVDLMDIFNTEPEATLFVGDRDEDQEAAWRAGVAFAWDHEYFADVDTGDFWTR